MAFHPARRVGEQGKTGSVRLRKTILGKSLNLANDAVSEIVAVAARRHAGFELLLELLQAPFPLPCGHGTAQLICLPGREPAATIAICITCS
jgi:hypothetical protein